MIMYILLLLKTTQHIIANDLRASNLIRFTGKLSPGKRSKFLALYFEDRMSQKRKLASPNILKILDTIYRTK